MKLHYFSTNVRSKYNKNNTVKYLEKRISIMKVSDLINHLNKADQDMEIRILHKDRKTNYSAYSTSIEEFSLHDSGDGNGTVFIAIETYYKVN